MNPCIYRHPINISIHRYSRPIYVSIRRYLTYPSIITLTIYVTLSLCVSTYLTAPKPLWDRFTSLNCDDLSQDAMGILKTTPECFVIMDHIFSYTESLNPCKAGNRYINSSGHV